MRGHTNFNGVALLFIPLLCQDTPNYNCTLLSIVTMLNTLHDRYFAGYAQTQANCIFK